MKARTLAPLLILGLAVQWGVKRGIYSNEAGQGTGPHSAAAAEAVGQTAQLTFHPVLGPGDPTQVVGPQPSVEPAPLITAVPTPEPAPSAAPSLASRA